VSRDSLRELRDHAICLLLPIFVKIEGIRGNWGVSKKQIQAAIKKRKQSSSSVNSSGISNAASGASKSDSGSSVESSRSS